MTNALRTRLGALLDRAGPAARRWNDALKSRRARRIAIGTGVVVLLYGILGFFALPAFLQPRLETMLAESLHRELRAQSLHFNPFNFSARIRGVRIADARTDEPPSELVLLEAEEIYANVSLSSLLRRVPVFDGVRLVRPHLRLRREADRRYNVQDLIDEWRNKPEEDPTRFSLSDLEVVDGRIDFDDRYMGEQHEVTALNLGVPFLSNQLSAVNVEVQPALSALVDGAPISIEGETHPFNDTHETVLRLQLEKLQVAKYLDYLPLRLHFAVASGDLDANLQLSLSTAEGKLKALSLSGTALAEKLELRQLSGDPIASIPAIRIALESYDFIGNELRIGHVGVEQPTLQLMRYKDGRLNAVALSAAPLPPPPGAPPKKPAAPRSALKFHIAEATLRGGTLRYKDIYNARPYQTQIKNVSLTGKQLGSGKRGTWQFSFDGESGERAEAEGHLAFVPTAADGRITLRGFKLNSWTPYYADAVNFEVRDGSLEAKTQIEFAEGEPLKLRFTDTDLSLRNVQFGFVGDKATSWRFPELDVRGMDIDVGERRVNIAEITGAKGVGLIKRLRDGTLHYQRLFGALGASPPKAGPPWQTTLQKVALRGFTLDYLDESTAAPVKAGATFIDFDGTNLSSVSDTPAQLSLKAMLNKTGSLSLAGPFDYRTRSGSLALEARGIDLVPFQPYWAEAVNFDLRRGTLGGRGQISIVRAPDSPTRVGYKGHVRVGDVQANDRTSNEELLTWRSLFFRNLSFETPPFKSGVERIILSDFYSRLVLNADGKLNLQSLRAAKEPKEPKPSPTPEAPKRVVEVGGIELRDGRVSFADYFVKPNYTAELKAVQGTVSALTPDKSGEVEIRAALNGDAPLRISGLINPLAKDLFLDLNANASDIDLPSLSPYSIKYAGYGIERGKLSFKAHYLVENRQLSADNQVTLDQLTFGPRSSAEGGPNLPVHLAVALLKDRNGVINVDLPISGSLDDPQFSLGGLIGRMFVNLVVKIVTSPFALIGRIFGGGDDAGELSYVDFDAGSAALDDKDGRKLEKLSTALNERPELKLDIKGRADPLVDRKGLARTALLRAMRAQKAIATGAANTGSLEIGQDEYNKYLALAYQASSIAKPRNFIGMAKDIPPAEMEKLLLDGSSVSDDQLRALADERAQKAKDWLLERGAPSARIYLVSSRIDADDIKEGNASRVEFGLR